MALLRGYLYVIVDKGRQFAKIGMARDVQSKFKDLQACCPLELEIAQIHPCTFVKFREYKTHQLLQNLRMRNEWFRWDETQIQAAVAKALAVPDEIIRQHLLTTPSVRHNFPVQRTDTGEIYPSAKAAAIAVFGSKEVAPKIKLAANKGVKCGPCFWVKVPTND